LFRQVRYRFKPYWDWFESFQEGSSAVLSQVAEETVIEQLKELLKEVVRERMISDVPLGAFLSGGVDSSAVCGDDGSLSNKPVKTFSIGFSRETYNELPYARMVAQRFSTEHYEYVLLNQKICVI
jgi:asparagine synthase (glutamine-hydrolysing)